MKIIIAGGRDFNNYPHLEKIMDYYNKKGDITEIVCGMAYGADSHGEYWARCNGIDVAEFPADWGKYGNRAGPVRNGEMADYADSLIVFWDGKSRGTKNMITQMEKLQKPNVVFGYE